MISIRKHIFDKFLRKNNCYDQFYANLDGDLDIKDLFRSNWRVGGPILVAFRWDDTPEGADFWFEVCRKWRNRF